MPSCFSSLLPWNGSFWEFGEVGVHSSFLLQKGQEVQVIWSELKVLSVRERHALWSLWWASIPNWCVLPFSGSLPGLADLAEWLWEGFLFLFPLSLGLVLLSSLFPFLFPPFLLTLLLLPCPFLSGPNVYFAPEPEAGRTHTDEVGRSKAASPALSSGAPTKERVIAFLLLLIRTSCTCSCCHLHLESWEPWSMACSWVRLIALAHNFFGLA